MKKLQNLWNTLSNLQAIHFRKNQKQLIILDDCCDQQFNYAKYDGNSISIESL